ncbi:hypothetical protein EDC94DRAFT_590716 [Helicostylum pulchrum]|nr:hypothetical protein EDC94DRAFT_590716 [Helicostylum pulchrum]
MSTEQRNVPKVTHIFECIPPILKGKGAVDLKEISKPDKYEKKFNPYRKYIYLKKKLEHENILLSITIIDGMSIIVSFKCCVRLFRKRRYKNCVSWASRPHRTLDDLLL